MKKPVKKYPVVRMRKETLKKFKDKQEKIQETIGRPIPLTLVFDSAASNPLFIKDVELSKLKKWRKYFK